jgi:mono/diheme cytochrome c family protein
MSRMNLIIGAALFGLILAITATPHAQQAKEDPQSILDRIYSEPQALRGEQRFKASCSSCHTIQEFAENAFADRWSGQTMAEAFEFVRSNMPENDPGGLKPAEYADVLAYILRANGYPIGTQDMPADKDALKKYEIVSNPK